MIKFKNADRLHWIKYGLSNSDETPYRPTLQRRVDELIYLHFFKKEQRPGDLSLKEPTCCFFQAFFYMCTFESQKDLSLVTLSI